MKTIHAASHAAHFSAHEHPARFAVGLAVAGLGAALLIAEAVRMLIGVS
jgi:hypothetical protein